MNYFMIRFDAHTTLILKAKMDLDAFAWIFKDLGGIKGFEPNTVLNPKQFQSISLVTNPSEQQIKVSRELDKVVI